ncbi:MAG: FKBP-type peptidyl-prolyl cis-trans isomerase [Dysgonamonadaceae bacterium]|jgi:FKBP-type peptidyl-prolyl cis-trans isomerase FklB|nr:FKBP-type peptidyl-prolyl cis-trans isomerase [Dysgonamonadaceae bacterium]MDD3355935.1 FKBP-type peptidyl-prolyl cis-trans isomerase [Dysgonamonadaceae bacterium]MDD3727797.1 FKBP-type peptidyl-prolyl cis-trans isomerase [Dysgonamonadaceae bacterium]MDD4246972.1 FKBP-type peptidyl-prolyl cis-trans isomerase [Dysgonamonadaceae bacterium]MDD4606616.1 FKBP-type peptidyl-prolyl cis-trans isomerase [Dysgonamonadaceae bacterium]
MKNLSYSLGMSMASQLMQTGLENLDVDAFVKAFTEIMKNEETSMSLEAATQHIQAYFNAKQNEMLEVNKQEGERFLSENKKKENVVELESGLQYEILTEGNGENPSATDKVKCHYHGTLLDGTVFDSSVNRGQPAVFGVNQVIKGWVEALQLMSVGSKWKLFIPPHLAYGEQGAGNDIEPNSTLIFDVELLGIEK